VAGQNYLIAYDISDNRQRRQALRLLRKVADCYQDSVFDIRATSVEMTNLQETLVEKLNEHDSLLCIKLNRACQSWQLGSGLEQLTNSLLVIR